MDAPPLNSPTVGSLSEYLRQEDLEQFLASCEGLLNLVPVAQV